MLTTFKEQPRAIIPKDAIISFRGDYSFLSNFYEREINYHGVIWPSTEHLFQGLKTLIPEFREIIRNAGTPGESKKLGRYSTYENQPMLRPDWDNIKDNVMAYITHLKYTQHRDLALRLIATDGKQLIEGNVWHDNYWGVCTCEKCVAKAILWHNKLGKTLMWKRHNLAHDGV